MDVYDVVVVYVGLCVEVGYVGVFVEGGFYDGLVIVVDGVVGVYVIW